MDNMSVLDRQYKEMTETSVEKLILRLSVPTIISMLVTNIYNMADTFFVGKLGTSASAAIGIVFSLMTINQALGFMCGHGCGSNISRKLGNKQGDAAIKFASTGFFMSLFLGVLIMIIGIIFMEPLLRIMGSTDTIMPYAKSYGICILLSAPFMTGSCVLNNVLRYEGKASLAMVGLTLGGVLNIIGDPIFIFVFNMGTLGAGISTAVSQVISFFVLLLMFGGDRTVSRLRFSAISWDIKDILNILYTGLPSLIRQGMMSVSTMVLNYMSMPYGDAAIAAMSIVSRVCNFIFAIALGISQGFQPVSAFNFGAKKFKRVKRAFIFCCGLSMIILGILSVLSLIFSGHIIGLFRDDADVIRIGTFALRAQSIVLFVSPITLAASMMFQGAGENLASSIASFLRSGITFIPMVAILPRFFGIYGIQLAQPLADVISFVVVMPLIVRFFKKINA
ncbi:MATE family efflux transporter [Lachnoanaerobaculum orale]|uniref:MATE family efflux transporter n=1 Tax=Lachnoanaerobaculum orale TaxID=979627 RepID=UPI0023A81153|nr:MATE family efflux transporter [Lachnoanaerobaculum orale]